MSSRLLAARALAFMAPYLFAGTRRRRAPQRPFAEECVVSECGPDGAPLSLYSG